MKLGDDVDGPQVVEQSNQWKVLSGTADKLAKASMGAPFGNFGAILKLGVQHIGGAPKNLSMEKIFTV